MARGTKFVKPLKGLLVRMPGIMTPLPENGAVVDWDVYWRRRLRDGSIEVVPRPTKIPETKTPTKISRNKEV